jgi:hypothetical protein
VTVVKLLPTDAAAVSYFELDPAEPAAVLVQASGARCRRPGPGKAADLKAFADLCLAGEIPPALRSSYDPASPPDLSLPYPATTSATLAADLAERGAPALLVFTSPTCAACLRLSARLNADPPPLPTLRLDVTKDELDPELGLSAGRVPAGYVWRGGLEFERLGGGLEGITEFLEGVEKGDTRGEL